MLSTDSEERLLEQVVKRGLLPDSIIQMPPDESKSAMIVKLNKQWSKKIDYLIASGQLDEKIVEYISQEIRSQKTAANDQATKEQVAPDQFDEDDEDEEDVNRTLIKDIKPTVEDVKPANVMPLLKAVGKIKKFPIEDWDRYEFIKLIGEGGMGRVYKARDPKLNRFVALKFIRCEDPGMVSRFAREAQAQARIDHPHICKVYEASEYEGHPYITMQYIDGLSLGDAKKKLTIDEKVRIIKEVAEALHAAHRLGLIHRDIKPANIMLEKVENDNWHPYVMDFGLARDMEGIDKTKSNMIVGTPAFMSPEQARGDLNRMDASITSFLGL
jgi:tRNA A-37 threonylcarbamoyl transferase component Bud32